MCETIIVWVFFGDHRGKGDFLGVRARKTSKMSFQLGGNFPKIDKNRVQLYSNSRKSQKDTLRFSHMFYCSTM